MTPYVEPGGSWRPLWIVAGVCVAFVALDVVLPGADIAPLVWVLFLVAVLGTVALGCLSARRVWTVRVEGRGPDGALTVGRERVRLSDVDAVHLRAVDSGVDAGAPVLGGGWSLPRGTEPVPIRLTDGSVVMGWARDADALRTELAKLLTAHG